MSTSLVTTRLLPGEYVLGHIGRSMCINSMSEEYWFGASADKYDLRGVERGQYVASRHTRAKIMSQCAGLASSDYLEAATMVPFVRAASLTGTMGSARGHRRGFNLHGESFALTHGVMPRYCRECVSDDNQALGYAYWRRAHQRPGAVVCWQHGQPLIECADGAVFAHPPGTFVGTSLDFLAQSAGSEVVKRFDELLDRWSSCVSAGYLESAAIGIRERVGSLDATASHEPLRNLFERRFPGHWLNKLYRWQQQSFRQRKGNRHFSGWNVNSVIGLSLIGASIDIEPEEAQRLVGVGAIPAYA